LRLALRLSTGYNNQISAKILLQAQARYYYYGIGLKSLSLSSGPHSASVFRIDEIMVGLVEVEACDINQIDGFGNTPLLLAVLNGTRA